MLLEHLKVLSDQLGVQRPDKYQGNSFKSPTSDSAPQQIARENGTVEQTKNLFKIYF